MVKVKALQSFAGAVSMRIGEERTIDLTDTMRELVACGYVEILEDLDERYDGIEIEEMTKRQLVRFAKDNRIPVAEKEKLEKIREQVKKHLSGAEEGSETKRDNG